MCGSITGYSARKMGIRLNNRWFLWIAGSPATISWWFSPMLKWHLNHCPSLWVSFTNFCAMPHVQISSPNGDYQKLLSNFRWTCGWVPWVRGSQAYYERYALNAQVYIPILVPDIPTFLKKYAYSCLSFWRCDFFATKVESSLGEGDGYIVGMRFYSTCLSCRPLKVPRSTRRICFPCGFDAKDLLSTLPWDREWLGDELKTASGAPRNAKGFAGLAGTVCPAVT